MASKGRGAHTKGFAYERTMAKKFSKAFHTNVQRTANSGATRGVETQYNHADEVGKNGFVGDLFFPKGHPMSIFNYELKNHDSVKFTQFFNCNGEIPSFIEQVYTDSSRLGGPGHSVPCLVIHIKREDDYIVIPFRTMIYKQLALKGKALMALWSYKQQRTGKVFHYQVIITNLKSFTQVKPEDYYQAYKDYDYERLNHYEPKHKKVDIDKLVSEIK